MTLVTMTLSQSPERMNGLANPSLLRTELFWLDFNQTRLTSGVLFRRWSTPNFDSVVIEGILRPWQTDIYDRFTLTRLGDMYTRYDRHVGHATLWLE